MDSSPSKGVELASLLFTRDAIINALDSTRSADKEGVTM